MTDSAVEGILTGLLKLQETLPTGDGHDVTSALDESMKQLNRLRQENFNLKLRIDFLEEKLVFGAHPGFQDLLEHNLQLQVEVEELRRQLSEKQELLASAAEASDVSENQGSISMEYAGMSINNSIAISKEAKEPVKGLENQTDAVDETYQSESAGCVLLEEKKRLASRLGLQLDEWLDFEKEKINLLTKLEIGLKQIDSNLEKAIKKLKIIKKKHF